MNDVSGPRTGNVVRPAHRLSGPPHQGRPGDLRAQ